MEPPVLSVPPPNLMPPPPAPDIATCNTATNNAPTSKITLKCGGKSFPILPCTTNNNNATAVSSNAGLPFQQLLLEETNVNKRRKKNNELKKTEKPNHDLGISVERINHKIEDDQDELPASGDSDNGGCRDPSETHIDESIRDGGTARRVWDGRIRSNRNNKKERAKFSYFLTESEIKVDFLKMLDPKEKPLRRQKKRGRPKDLQKQFDSLVPGFHLTEIKADLYKVHDDTH
ncbi:hypothetical protein PIB30_042749 [Stylosanthes scabra]|uniref:Uncharacterized protein n=1 Tax=Stylosanthes scabra TaxID=79078 RepID=A0ABU6SGC5_9FABA|nr:hypothetical protein [Stylosanthes scabra]